MPLASKPEHHDITKIHKHAKGIEEIIFKLLGGKIMARLKSFSMISVFVCLFAALGLSGCKDSGSPEHPRGFLSYAHAQQPNQEHILTPAQSQKGMIEEFSRAVEDYVKETLKITGTMPVRNIQGESVAIPGKLELVRIHKDRITRYEGNTYFACADFVAKYGISKTYYDLDFFMTKMEDKWKLDKILLHNIDNELQLIYEDNKPVPVKGKKPKREHP